jgi:uncharacterized protein (DUF433 family)
MTALTIAPHLWQDDEQRIWIDDTNTKVIEVVLDHLAYGWSADAMHEQHSHLSLAQIYAALAYFYDHEEEFERLIVEQQGEVAALREEFGESPLQRRLRQLKYAR